MMVAWKQKFVRDALKQERNALRVLGWVGHVVVEQTMFWDGRGRTKKELGRSLGRGKKKKINHPNNSRAASLARASHIKLKPASLPFPQLSPPEIKRPHSENTSPATNAVPTQNDAP